MPLRTIIGFIFILSLSINPGIGQLSNRQKMKLSQKESDAWMAQYKYKFEKAIKLYTELIEMAPKEDYFSARATCYNSLRQYDRAIEDYTYLLNRYSPRYTYYIEISKLEQKKNNHENARKIIEQGIIYTAHPQLYRHRANIHFNSRNYLKARNDYRLAMEKIKTQHIENSELLMRGLTDDFLKVWDGESAIETISYWEENIDESFFEGWSDTESLLNDAMRASQALKADAYGYLGNYDEALDLIRPMVANETKSSTLAGLSFISGRIRMLSGQYMLALGDLRRSKANENPFVHVDYFIGECFYQLGNINEAIRIFESWDLTAEGKSPSAKAYKILASLNNDQEKDGLSDLNKLVDDNPGNGELHFIKARALAVTGQNSDALESLEQAFLKGFYDFHKYRFGLKDLEPVLRQEGSMELLARYEIKFPYRQTDISLREGLIKSSPYIGHEQRLALIIGNGLYKYGGILANPENDANDMAAVLEHMGFEVIKYENIDQDGMKRAIDEFGYKLKMYDVGLFFYAGHGVQAKGINYLIPVDAKIMNESDVEFTCVNAGRVLARMEDANNRVNIIILDACRDNPFERSWSRSASGRGLAKMDAPKGSIIAYATEPGNTASDGPGRNGLYTEALLNEMQTPGIIIEKVFRQARIKVIERSGERQTPWESTSLTGDFYFLDR